MFTQSVHSSSEIAFAEQAIIPMWCAFNPNVDRSAPPKKKTAKRKTAKKKPAKRR